MSVSPGPGSGVQRNSNALTGIPVSSVVPTDTQVLTFSSAIGQWTPATPSASIAASAAIQTDWVAYTPTFFTGLGSVTNVNFRSRRQGPDLQIIGTFTAGTPSGSTAAIAIGFNGSSGGITGATWFTTTTPIGDWARNNVNAAGPFTRTILVGTSATGAMFGFMDATHDALTAQPGNTFVGAGDNLTVKFVLPINGWLANG